MLGLKRLVLHELVQSDLVPGEDSVPCSPWFLGGLRHSARLALAEEGLVLEVNKRHRLS